MRRSAERPMLLETVSPRGAASPTGVDHLGGCRTNGENLAGSTEPVVFEHYRLQGSTFDEYCAGYRRALVGKATRGSARRSRGPSGTRVFADVFVSGRDPTAGGRLSVDLVAGVSGVGLGSCGQEPRRRRRPRSSSCPGSSALTLVVAWVLAHSAAHGAYATAVRRLRAPRSTARSRVPPPLLVAVVACASFLLHVPFSRGRRPASAVPTMLDAVRHGDAGACGGHRPAPAGRAQCLQPTLLVGDVGAVP